MGLFNSYNRVVVMGNMTRDAEINTIPSGAVVTEVGLAINDRIKKGNEWVDDVTFVDITAWNKTAEFLQRFGGKGKCVLVEGRLKMDKWVDKQSGQNRSKLKIVADSITFCDSGDKQSGGGGGAQRGGQTPYATDAGGMGDESLPF